MNAGMVLSIRWGLTRRRSSKTPSPPNEGKNFSLAQPTSKTLPAVQSAGVTQLESRLSSQLWADLPIE